MIGEFFHGNKLISEGATFALLFVFMTVYEESKGYYIPDSEVVSKLDSPTELDVAKALKILKRRRFDLSNFLPKILPRLIDKSLMKRSSTYSLIKKYYPEIESELAEIKSSKAISDLSYCKKVVEPILEKHGLNSNATVVSPQKPEHTTEDVDNSKALRADFPHSSEIQISEMPIGKLSKFTMQLLCLFSELLIVLLILGIPLAFFVQGWGMKLMIIIGFFALGYGLLALKIPYKIRKFYMKKISYGNEHIKKCMITTEKLGTQDKLHFFEDDAGYLFATSDGFRLVTINGVDRVLELDTVKFIRVSERKSSCAIDCQMADGTSIFEFIINPIYDKWDFDTVYEGRLQFDWFINHMELEEI